MDVRSPVRHPHRDPGDVELFLQGSDEGYGLGMAMFGPERFRSSVAPFNQRSIRLCRSAGIEVVREFDWPGRRFQEMIRPAP